VGQYYLQAIDAHVTTAESRRMLLVQANEGIDQICLDVALPARVWHIALPAHDRLFDHRYHATRKW
jgi:hypothetical protein